MKNLFLIWVVFLMYSFTPSDTNFTTESYTLVNSNNLGKLGCNSRCGDLIVPYPFGVGDNSECYINEGFRIYCNTSVNPPKASIFEDSYTSIKVISDSTLRTTNKVASRCYYPNGTTYNNNGISTNFNRSPYTFSEVNRFTVIGCNDYAWLTSTTMTRNLSTGCMVFCATREEVVGDECTGNGCCQTSIPQDINYYTTELNSLLNNVSNRRSFAPCTYAFVGEENKFKFNGATDLINVTSFVERIEATVPRVLEWAIGNLNCSVAGATDGYVCQSNSMCVNSNRETGGYRCVCKEGYEGNPYLSPGCQERTEAKVPVVHEWAIGNLSCSQAEATNGYACQSNSTCVSSKRESGGYRCVGKECYEGNPYLSPGCKDINECEDSRTYPCYGDCINTQGSYNCTCFRGTTGDAKTPTGCQPVPAKDARWKIFIIVIVIGLLAILCGILGILFGIRKRKVTKLREKFFEQNGGVLLKQKIDSQGSHKEMTLFSTAELRKATDNYSQEKIVGQGAYGVVYKGILSDKRVVAIKKSKVVDGSQAEQFINEVLILTQVIHRNVVKLLGCCLEEEVPVLVYEFISNNTLYHHIHHRLGGMSWLSWENRLRIAAEAAGALAYLHSETIMPIIHRDVKSTNILLDDNYTAKISDFGASRLVPIDHEQVTTLILGTLGYLDPQYYHTSHLTEKSDVYSFGVVLAELITGKKPIGADRINEEKNLATYFVNSVKENRLFEIVEPRLLREGTLDKLHTLADLVKRCLNLQSHDRPTMKEVAMELEGLRNLTTHPWISQTSQETRSLVLEVEQSDLYDAPLVSYGPNEWDSYSGSRNMVFEENESR